MILTTRYGAAVAFAAEAHAGQVRKGTTVPYITHPLAVSALVIEHGGDEDQAIGGLLHDVLEDCGEAYAATILDRFGARVLGIVRGCTDGLMDAQGRKPDWHTRKAAYVAHLAEADFDTVLVSACDKLHNARAILADREAIGDAVFDRFRVGRADTERYYRSLHAVFARRLGPDHALVGDLGRTLDRTYA